MTEIPDGWVRMAAYDTREDKSSGGPSDDYRRLLAASKKNPPEFGVLRLSDLYGTLVFEDEADAYLQRLSAAAVVRPATHKAEPSLHELTEKVASLCELVEKLLETLT